MRLFLNLGNVFHVTLPPAALAVARNLQVIQEEEALRTHSRAHRLLQDLVQGGMVDLF